MQAGGAQDSFGTFFGRISRRTRRSASALERTGFIRAMRKGVRPAAHTTSPRFPIRLSRRSSNRTCATCGRTCAACRRATARASRTICVSVWLPLAVWGWSCSFSPLTFTSDPAGNATLNRGAYLVNALAIAANATRHATFSAVRRRTAISPAASSPSRPPYAHTAQEEERWRAEGLPPPAMTPTGTSQPRPWRRWCAHHEPADPAGSRRLIAYLRSLPPLPDEPNSVE